MVFHVLHQLFGGHMTSLVKFFIVAVGGSWYSETINSKISSASQLPKTAIWAMQEEYLIIQYNYYKYCYNNIRNKLKYLVSVRQDDL